MTKDITGRAKQCPMCGSKRIYLTESNFDDSISMIKIHCADCGLNGYKNFTKDAKDTEERTIQYWNKRAPDTEETDAVVNKMLERIRFKIKYVQENFTEWNESHAIRMSEIDGMIDMLSIVTGKSYVVTSEGLEEREEQNK